MALTHHTKTTKITVTRPEGVYIAQVVTTWKEPEVSTRDEVIAALTVNEEDQYVCLCGKVFTKGGDEPPHSISFDLKKGWVCSE